MLEHLRSRLESGAFPPVLDPTTYPLDDIVEAHRYVETGQKLGNVVITVTERPASRPIAKSRRLRRPERTSSGRRRMRRVRT